MKFSISPLFQIVVLLLLKQIFCGDGVGDNILKILKTTTPVRRPQKNGYFLNVHEEENIEKIQKDAIEKGLESRIDQLKNKLDVYYDDVLNDSKEMKLEQIVRRKANLINSVLGGLKK